jgi:hypothetical protein
MDWNDGFYNGDVAAKRSHRIKVGELIITVREDRNVQLGIYRAGREGLPHLTINWGNPDKHIHFHLTTNLKECGKNYDDIAKVSESDLAKHLRSFEPELIGYVDGLRERVRPVSIGWLRSRGFRVFSLGEDGKREVGEKAFARRKLGKRKRWTYIPDSAFINNVGRSPEIMRHLYHPRKLRQMAIEGWADPVIAECCYGKRRGRVIQLMLRHRANGEPYWAFLDLNLLEGLSKVTGDFLERCLKQLLPDDSWERISKALCLEEIGW